jgi:hypothetical protein
MSVNKYDETLRHDLVEAFGKIQCDLAPCGVLEVIDAGIDCLVIALIQHVGRESLDGAIVNPFLKRVSYALKDALGQVGGAYTC